MNLKNQNNRLGTETIFPLLLKLSIPSILSMFIQALYNVVDSIFVARLGKDALAALSLAFPIQMILIAIAVGTGTGTSSIISRLLGEGKNKRASNVAEHVLLIALCYGTIVAITGFFLAENLISFFTKDKILIDYGTQYIRIILLGSTALFIPMIVNNILRGEGNTFIPMITMLIGSILNIILDPLLIFGYGFFPALGVKGAAIATVLSRVISGTFILLILFKGSNQIKLNLRAFQFDFSIIKDIYQIGLPAMTMQILASFTIGGLNLILSNYSSTAIAALGIYFRLESFVFMPVFGLNQGYLPILGYNYGYKKPQRMKKTMKCAFAIGFTFTMLGCLLFQIFPVHLIKLFDSNPELVSIGKDALKKISLAYPIIGPAIIGSTTFQAFGKGLPSLILSFLRQILFLLPLAFILAKINGLNWIWYAFPISEVLAGLLMVTWLRRTLKEIFSSFE
jgi:putative MATE family efflux protein